MPSRSESPPFVIVKKKFSPEDTAESGERPSPSTRVEKLAYAVDDSLGSHSTSLRELQRSALQLSYSDMSKKEKFEALKKAIMATQDRFNEETRTHIRSKFRAYARTERKIKSVSGSSTVISNSILGNAAIVVPVCVLLVILSACSRWRWIFCLFSSAVLL